MRKRKSNQAGMTYAEVAVCLFVMVIIIMPICAALVSSTKTRVESETISTSTLNAEAFMEDIEQQLDKDIALKHRIEGSSLTTAEEAKRGVLEGRIQYLKASSPIAEINLNTFFSDAKLNAKYKAKYDLSRYAYEVALWDLHQIPLTGGSLTLDLNAASLGSAIKLYSDNTEPKLCFGEYTGSTGVVTLDIPAEKAAVFQNRLYIDRFIPTDFTTSSGYVITGLSRIRPEKESDKKLKSSSTDAKAEYNTLTISKTDINNGDNGCIYEIKDNSSGSAAAAGGSKKAIVILDLRDVTTGFAPSFPMTFRFINKTGYTVNIKVLRNAKEGKKLEDVDKEIIDKYFNIEVDEASTGETVIERVEDDFFAENYLITVIVRDKNPRLGQSGKIVKKMVDIYSYTPNK